MTSGRSEAAESRGALRALVLGRTRPIPKTRPTEVIAIVERFGRCSRICENFIAIRTVPFVESARARLLQASYPLFPTSLTPENEEPWWVFDDADPVPCARMELGHSISQIQASTTAVLLSFRLLNIWPKMCIMSPATSHWPTISAGGSSISRSACGPTRISGKRICSGST